MFLNSIHYQLGGVIVITPISVLVGTKNAKSLPAKVKPRLNSNIPFSIPPCFSTYPLSLTSLYRLSIISND